ncbi:hypothetical protein [Vibrio coralliirubri]|uniref:hypothetical protein n=1 Tax=Vibrio coralliirubri TaxID=1516159 RepID=UPI00073F0E1A|nr:hypothetical protein [Vibrio coralliirubri]
MNKRTKLLGLSLVMTSLSALSSGGYITDPATHISFNYDNVTLEVAQEELATCQGVAESTLTAPTETKKGSGVKGAAKGAAAGAISGGSGSDAAKTGAAIGVVSGRVSGRRAGAQAEEDNKAMYATVLRNCMIDKKYNALN